MLDLCFLCYSYQKSAFRKNLITFIFEKKLIRYNLFFLPVLFASHKRNYKFDLYQALVEEDRIFFLVASVKQIVSHLKFSTVARNYVTSILKGGNNRVSNILGM